MSEDGDEDDEEAEAERAQRIRRAFPRPRFEAPQPILDPHPPRGVFLARDQVGVPSTLSPASVDR